MADGLGSITFWGFTPALDLQENMTVHHDHLNILMVGAGDCRHILKTLARSYRHDGKQINFYVIENNMELYARHLLLLSLALENQHRMGLQEKTELFLELYGNSLVREQSIQYVQRTAPHLIKMVTDLDHLEVKLPLVELSLLKFKERDMLEGIFKFWRNPDRSAFDAEKCWDLRLRQYLGVRYDAVPNVFDWDYNMKLVEKGAGIIHHSHYSRWRHQGIAFEIREGTYDVSNRTLASGMVFQQGGERVARRGYWGDILVSPYISLGIESEDKSFFKQANNQYTATASDVAEFNVMAMFHELCNQTPYQPPKAHDDNSQANRKQSATLTEITEEEGEEETTVDINTPTQISDTKCHNMDTEYDSRTVPNAKVFFLPLGYTTELHRKPRFKKLFNLAYFSNSLVHTLTEDLSQTFADKATVLLETSKFMLELKQEQHEQFISKVTGMAQRVGCKAAGPVDKNNDAFITFSYDKSDAQIE